MSNEALDRVDATLSKEIGVALSRSAEEMSREIEERMLRLERQRASLQRMSGVLEASQRKLSGSDQAVCGFLSLGAGTSIVAIDPQCAGLFGAPPEFWQGRYLTSLVVPDEREHWSRVFDEAWMRPGTQTGKLSLQLPDGAVLDVRFACCRSAMEGESDILRMALVEVSDHCRLARELADLRDDVQCRPSSGDNWLQGIIEQSLAGIYLIQEGRFAYANQGFADIFGYASPAELIGNISVGALIVPEERDRVAENIRRRMDGEVPEMRYAFTGLRKDGRRVEVEVHGRRMEYEGKPAVIGVILDISERKQAEQQLRIAAAAFEAQEGMFVTDAERVVLRINEAFSAITGYSAEEIVGSTPAVLRSDRHDGMFYDSIWETARNAGTWQGEVWNRRKNGEVFPEWTSVTSVKNSTGEITHYVATFVDMSERKAAESEIEYLAFYDQLTRLPNRRLLLDRLQQALAASARGGTEGALLFIDLDNFKDLNDTLGHDKGDLLLKQVAERLSSCLRDGDTVARLGGDEFVMMLEGLSGISEEAAAQSKSIGEEVLKVLNRPYPLANREHHSTPSIGVTLFSDQKDNIDELLKRADLAMYKAKQAGRNTLCFFDPDMQAAVTARTAMESDMRIGMREGQFMVYYQPQVDDRGEWTGVEALLRWQHPLRGLIPPSEFIPVAELSGQILPLGSWVLETACRQLVAWSANPRTAHLSIAINVSARQFHHPLFVEQVLSMIDSTGACPGNLKLELTESLLLHDVDDVIAKMSALKASGVGFSLDDFGTGYSSLAYLKRLPLDQLKIDQSFVSDVVTNDNDAAITSAIVALARKLGLSVMAEGVETAEQRDFLVRQGCHTYQGYFFGRPVSVESLEQMLQHGVVGSDQDAPTSPGLGDAGIRC